MDDDPGFAERFTREARTLAKLSHPNIVAVYDFGQSGGYRYFLMEYVDGLNLRQIERAGKLSPREALAIIPSFARPFNSRTTPASSTATSSPKTSSWTNAAA